MLAQILTDDVPEALRDNDQQHVVNVGEEQTRRRQERQAAVIRLDAGNADPEPAVQGQRDQRRPADAYQTKFWIPKRVKMLPESGCPFRRETRHQWPPVATDSV